LVRQNLRVIPKYNKMITVIEFVRNNPKVRAILKDSRPYLRELFPGYKVHLSMTNEYICPKCGYIDGLLLQVYVNISKDGYYKEAIDIFDDSFYLERHSFVPCDFYFS